MTQLSSSQYDSIVSKVLIKGVEIDVETKNGALDLGVSIEFWFAF